MNVDQALALAKQIEREAPGATATVQPDGRYATSYHIEVHKPKVIKFAVRSITQWNERKQLL